MNLPCLGVVVSLGLLALAPVAEAQTRQTRTLYAASGGKDIIVWRDDKAHSEANKLIAAGVHKSNPALLVPLIACIAPVGSQAIKTDGGFFSSTIMVTSGKESGCRGVVPNERLSPPK